MATAGWPGWPVAYAQLATDPNYPMNTPPEIPPPVTEDRTVAILAYLTPIGFIVAIILHGGRKTAVGTYHLRQCLGLYITALVFGVAMMVIGIIPLIGPLIGFLNFLGFVVLWIMGLIAAINGQQKPMPVVGGQFQKWFANTFT